MGNDVIGTSGFGTPVLTVPFFSGRRAGRRVEHGLPTTVHGRFVASADRAPPWTYTSPSMQLAVRGVPTIAEPSMRMMRA
jgi:hypothetical protein